MIHGEEISPYWASHSSYFSRFSATRSHRAATLADEIEIADDEEFDAARVLANIPQGRELRLNAEFLNWKVNKSFKGKLIMATTNAKTVTLKGGLQFTVVGPMKEELQALQKKHDAWLRERKKKKKSSEAALAAFTDKSISNLSSIVLLAKVDSDAGPKTMLLTGDARGDKILEGLQLVGLLGDGNASTMHVNLLKVPHHGSANNIEISFFKRITADHYVFSGMENTEIQNAKP